MSKIKVILWDVDGTLLNFEAAERVAIRSCFAQFNLGECTDAMLEEYSAINRKYWERLERGEITKPEVLTGRFYEFFGNYGLDTSVVPAFNAQYQLSLGDTVCFHDNAPEVIRALSAKVKQYVVTNGTRIAQERKLKNSGLGEKMAGIFISELVGAEKPSVTFFDAVWAEIGRYNSDEVMIVGDSLTSDMRGGNNAGIICCWYNPGSKPVPQDLRIDYNITSLEQVLDICKD